MTTIAVEIPDSVFPALQLDPKEFAKEMRLAAAAIKWYELGRVSQGKGAEVANLVVQSLSKPYQRLRSHLLKSAKKIC